jgi:hypothetical protein
VPAEPDPEPEPARLIEGGDTSAMRTTSRPLLVLAAFGLASALVGCSGGDGGGDASGGTTTTTQIPAGTKADDSLRLNEIQTLGTHNSFHVAPPKGELDLLAAMNAEQASEREYSHSPLPTQFGEEKIRQIELDVFVDETGMYATPSLRRQAGSPPLVDELPEMAEPGTKVMHEQDVDYHSVCPTMTQCMEEIKAFSDANPTHVPIAVQIQFKDGPLIFPVADQVRPELWTLERMEALEDEILAVLGRDRILTPDDVRGDRETLEEAVLTDGWPTLGETRGKVLFTVVNGGTYPLIYTTGHELLQDRLFFVNADPGTPNAGFVNVDDPLDDGDELQDLVEKGYLVRTRSDTPGREAAAGDTDRLDAALERGAHFISTDYPSPKGAARQYPDSDYVAAIPGGVVARCNPVTAPDTCVDGAVEPPG